MALVIKNRLMDGYLIHVAEVFTVEDGEKEQAVFVVGTAVCTSHDDPRINLTADEWGNNMDALDVRLPLMSLYDGVLLTTLLSRTTMEVWGVQKQVNRAKRPPLPDVFMEEFSRMNLDPGAPA
jgi:hypothetical protein